MRCQSRAAPTSRSLDLGIPPGPCITYPQPHRTAAPKSHCGRSGPVFDPARQRRGVRVLLHRFGIVSHRTGRRSRSPVQRLGRVLRRLVPGDRLILVHPVADRRGAPQKVEVFGVLLGTRKRGAQTLPKRQLVDQNPSNIFPIRELSWSDPGGPAEFTGVHQSRSTPPWTCCVRPLWKFTNAR
jgi:hypothetical protein